MMEPKNHLNILRHSAAHLLAAAVQELYPNTKLGIGPATEDGFYYDFDFGDKKLTADDLPKIEQKMREIQSRGEEFMREEIPAEKAKEIFNNQPYKLQLIDELKDSQISIYKTGSFVDLCKGPHTRSTANIGPFKLLSIAGAYWRGSEENPMLTRIYGTAFPTQKELDDYLKKREEAQRRDHKKLGRELDLFFISETVGQGLPLFTAKGATIKRELENWVIEEELKRGYVHVSTPDLARTKLYEISGHYPYYADTMYPVMEVDQTKLVLRPMSCPHHFMIYAHKLRSYRDLPLRIAELAKLYRYEKSGELSGLQRVRGFCLADAHIFCRQRQAHHEIKGAIELIDHLAQTLGLKRGQDYRYRLSLGDSTNQEKYFNDPQGWQRGEKILKEVLEEINAPYHEAPGEAAFYGPKIDIQMKNIYGKEDTAFTVQYDFCLPSRFNLNYTNENGEPEQPVVIHRSSIGAIERTLAFLIEFYAGAFPVWLAPVQAVVIPIGERHLEYAKEIEARIKKQELRIEVDDRNETLNKKIRNAQEQKIPYMLIVGDKELEQSTTNKQQFASVRLRTGEDLGLMPIDKFYNRLENRILTKSLNL